MSARLFPDDLRFEQRLLKSAGFYKGRIDGLYGPLTAKAEDEASIAYARTRKTLGEFDARSEKNIATLMPAMQMAARKILAVARAREALTGLRCVVLSGTRTYAEQDRLFAKRPKVTNARGGQSNHNFGIAIDVGLFKGAKYLTGATKAETKAYADLGAAVKAAVHGVEWGGDWKSFVDMPHYQLATGKTLAQVRGLFEAGKAFA